MCKQLLKNTFTKAPIKLLCITAILGAFLMLSFTKVKAQESYYDPQNQEEFFYISAEIGADIPLFNFKTTEQPNSETGFATLGYGGGLQMHYFWNRIMVTGSYRYSSHQYDEQQHAKELSQSDTASWLVKAEKWNYQSLSIGAGYKIIDGAAFSLAIDIVAGLTFSTRPQIDFSYTISGDTYRFSEPRTKDVSFCYGSNLSCFYTTDQNLFFSLKGGYFKTTASYAYNSMLTNNNTAVKQTQTIETIQVSAGIGFVF